jgi:hypothetical protein
MKKLLNVLGAVLILGSSTTAVAACGGKPKGNDDANLTDLQKNMLSGAEFMTKVILAGRHENLNYNVNEVLSTFMAPISTLSNIPLNYNFDGKPVDLASGIQNYKNVLAPQMSTWDQDNYAGFYASYVMGMYDNKFYQDYWANDNGYFKDTISADGNYGINQADKNADGFAAGLTSWDLSKDKERRELAWGIQDTGPLTNYFLKNGLDGGYPDDTSGTANPNSPASESTGGTNASGYLFYNSQVASSRGYLNGAFKDSNSYNNKLKESEVALIDQTSDLKHPPIPPTSTNWTNAKLEDGTEFGETGALFAKTGANLNINGYSTSYTGLLNMVSESESGAAVLGKFLDGIFPILQDNGSSKSVQSAGYKLWSSPLVGLYKNSPTDGDQGYYNDGVLNILKSLDDTVSWEKFNNVKAPSESVKPINSVFPNPVDATMAADLIDQICTSFEKASADKQKEFYDNALSATEDSDGKYSYGILIKGMSSMVINKSSIPADSWTKIAGANNGQGGINLLHAVSRAVRATYTFKDQVDKVTEKYGKKQYKRLTTGERNDYLKMLGWDGTKFKKDSLLKDAYDTLKTEKGSSEFSALLGEFANITSNQMKDPHSELIQYMTGDSYWKDSDVKISVKDNKQIHGKMTFTLDYNGVGDTTSNADKQTSEIDPSQKFNPYQTILDYQDDKLSVDAKNMIDKDKISGEVLGAKQLNMDDDALKAYDGTGMLINMKPTHHQYKVSWENVGDSEHPYWVITSIHSFNDKGEEFYNIY